MAKKKIDNVLGVNKKARFEYSIEENFECGIVLEGTEVKSLRLKKFNFNDSFVEISKENELFLKNLHISPYALGTHANHEPLRRRKLLMHKKEILKIGKKLKERGYTLIPLKFYLVGGLIKLEIALAKGKKLHDKRESIKERDTDRITSREVKKY